MPDLFEKKMANKYHTRKDLMDRLQSTYVRYNGQIVFVADVTSTPKLVLWDDASNGREVARIQPDDPLLDISGIELGYGHSPKGVTYVYRTAAKHYKQGTCPDHVYGKGINGEGGQSVWHETLMSCLREEFPTFQEFLADWKGDKAEAALSRSIACKAGPSGLIRVYYRMEEIGWIDWKAMTVSGLDNNYGWIVRRDLLAVGLRWKEI